MKWLRLFKRDDDEETPVERPVAARHRAAKPGASPGRKSSDKSGLAIRDEAEGGGSPYESHSWQADPVKGLRRVDAGKTTRRTRGKKEDADPYNTGGFRKGW